MLTKLKVSGNRSKLVCCRKNMWPRLLGCFLMVSKLLMQMCTSTHGKEGALQRFVMVMVKLQLENKPAPSFRGSVLMESTALSCANL
ncbi:Os02g0512300 [Oryza sativa Japonica Group]|uniref:Os02g0512300 protein n=1 Tax=Oryza sativa subsp. japonica TaxID=39947 RepID=Q6K610_ORYSJ|nr:unknown protein [Oryza sativa Japonica Group]BAD23237.1 unknown protein [Oryza sativa Japonica Group]BAH91711.1 Os02g0512300 [Oryza sativa Japonica Group]|eukprot:NP_001172982.1 Os02g0512300 [Oryza sativa Japonica Group]